ncbi:MAG: 6-phosphofructokinase [Bacteroidetes bacterium]|nr:MAG: 6-phosphofructokinase [Bacteroidota bacterium]
MKKIALMTSGGDSPGMNACVRAIVKSCLADGIVPVGVLDGFQGMIEDRMYEMTYSDVNNIVQMGGTILGTARSKQFLEAPYRKQAIGNLRQMGVEGLIVIGGDGSFTGATVLSEEMDIPVIGIPGTIDNDIYGTDHTIGYDTALNTVVEAVDRIRDTANSHHRIFFVEVMGRHAGFIALNAAVASGAESVLIPEADTDIESLARQIKEQNRGKRSSIVLVAEGDDAGGSLEVIRKVSPYLEGYTIRASVLGHIQRGGRPSAFDRILATRMGCYAVELLEKGKRSLMIGSMGDQLQTIPIADGIKYKSSPLDQDKLNLLKKMLTTN